MIHCRMLDDTAQLQQEALGILGVNLVHGALSKGEQHYQVLAGLMDDLGRSRIEVPSMAFIVYAYHTCTQPPHTVTLPRDTVQY